LIEGDASDHALPFVNTAYNVSDRIRTTASVGWNPPDWSFPGLVTPDQQTADISSIIGEIVNRQGWTTGNSIALIITGTGKRTAKSYNGAPTQGPVLHIEYFGASTAEVSNDNFSGVDQRVTQESSLAFFDKPKDESLNEWNVRIRPNPFSDEFSLVISHTDEEVGEGIIQIMDINGRVIYEQINVPFEQDQIVIAQKEWPSGLYFVRVQAAGSVRTLKVIKQ
jgi:hypothetical protein